MTYQKRITCGAAASLMASLVVASVGLLFSNPSAAADDAAIKRLTVDALTEDSRELGPKGERAPPASGPGVIVNTPVIVFEPRMETTAKASKE